MAPSTEQHEPFRTTHWSLVLEASEGQNPRAQEAFAALYRIYWKPLYTFLRRQGHSRQDSEDLIQGLFSQLSERREFFGRADRDRGQFRSFLLGALKFVLSDRRTKESAQKRGGGALHLSLDTETVEASLQDRQAEDPGEAFDRQWALTVLEEALQRLRSRATDEEEFTTVMKYISGKSGTATPAALARELGVSESAFKMKASRLRQALRDRLHEVVAETVTDFTDVPHELAYLKKLMTSSF